MATKSRRFQPVVHYAQSKEDEAARRLGDSQKNLLDQQQKLQGLETYLQEYSANLTQVGQIGMSAGQVQSYHAFLTKLREAIKQQLRLVEIAESDLDVKRKAWFLANGRTKTFSSVMERYLSEEAREALRKEQKSLDEFAQRSGQRRRQEFE